MKLLSFKHTLSVGVSALMLGSLMPAAAHAQSSDADAYADEIITIGTRRKARSAADTPAPVDVISAAEITNQAATDVLDVLRTSVPSFNVNTQPISDAATIVRPPNLRGLSPDQVLVLMNGKRRHRAAVIAFLGGGVSDGAQGADIGVFPTLALKDVQVLRDGASSQYGSDAIAGVMSFTLKDAAEGGMAEVKYGSTYEGDGDNFTVALNKGFALGDQGFINATVEYGEADGTVRAADRSDVTALVAAGNTDVADYQTVNSYTDQYAQYWGQPDVKNSVKLFINSALEITDDAELYAFGNYAKRETEGGFFYRNPTNRGGVYNGPLLHNPDGADVSNLTELELTDADGDRVNSLSGIDDTARAQLMDMGIPVSEVVDSVLVGAMDGNRASCMAGLPLTEDGGLIVNPTALSTLTGSANCFSFAETIPGGFVPRFGGPNEDLAITGGIRGEIGVGSGLGYDLSATYGENDTSFLLKNSINASLGPNTPRDFNPGSYNQAETILNADFTYEIPFAAMGTDLGVAFGGEYRKETFTIGRGDDASHALGPLATQGFSSSSNGFGGFANSHKASQDSIAGYVEVETDINDDLTLQGAVRYEDYSAFGDTLDFKIAGLYHVGDLVTLRGTYSTGFHAPSAGQATVTNVTTQIIGGNLIDQGTLPLASAPGQLAADFIASTSGGVRPELGTEDANNISLGAAFDTGPVSWKVDYYNIQVDGRIALGNDVAFIEALDYAAAQAGNPAGYDNSSVNAALNSLSTAGVINRSDYIGFEDLTEFRYFTNSFDTKTQGVDIIGEMPLNYGPGTTSLLLAANYTETEVTDRGNVNPISDDRVLALEELLPNWKGFATLNTQQGDFRGLLRVNYYGPWYDNGNDYKVGSEFIVDAEVGYEVREGLELIAGAANLLDNYPDKNPGQTGTGQLYPESSPIGFAGGQYYVKARYTF